jgi:hypothetical protein
VYLVNHMGVGCGVTSSERNAFVSARIHAKQVKGEVVIWERGRLVGIALPGGEVIAFGEHGPETCVELADDIEAEIAGRAEPAYAREHLEM